MAYTEANYEDAVLGVLEDLGYAVVAGAEVEVERRREVGYRTSYILEEIKEGLCCVNPGVADEVLAEALRRIEDAFLESGALVVQNQRFTEWMQCGMELPAVVVGEERTIQVKLFDFEHVERNLFTAVKQWTVVGSRECRADIVVFVNGLPLAVVELKSPTREEADASEAYTQLQRYFRDVPALFVSNLFCVMSDHAASKVGTLTAGEDRFMGWKSMDGEVISDNPADFETFFRGLFTKAHLLDLLHSFTCFSEGRKILAGYHQFFAVRKAVLSTIRATERDGKAGVFWHTQGSGKSLSMVFYARLLQEALKNPTIVVLTDRNDLDEQLFAQFAACAAYLWQIPVQAESREHLQAWLRGRSVGGILFTTMQKFEEVREPLSERRNIVVIADEAHRGQYGLEEHIDAATGRIVVGAARKVRESLPNATFIGFTGTPIAERDRDTCEVFGPCVDIYDMTQAVADGATRPVYYESRVVKLRLDDATLRKIDAQYDLLAETEETETIEASKRDLSTMEHLLGAPNVVQSLCEDIVRHYEDARQYESANKAMIVVPSRAIAVSVYEHLLAIRPQWEEGLAVVMTGGAQDPEAWAKHAGTKATREVLAKRFKDEKDTLRIVIVVDMWLTGFNVPALGTMYVYKPMAGHTLMQAITRVNRVFKDKAGGLIVDYVGIARALKEAMNAYTVRDRNRYGDLNVRTVAIEKFHEHLTICQEQLHGLDIASFYDGDNLARARLITRAVDFLSAPQRQTQRDIFCKQARLLKQAYSLCRSVVVVREERLDAALFEAIRTVLMKIEHGSQHLSLRKINQAISELLKQSVQSDGVVSLFTDNQEQFSLFDTKFLEEIASMQTKNLSIALLRRLLEERLYAYRRQNVVASVQFSERLRETMNAYVNGLISNEQVIAELLALAHCITDEVKKGNALGLTQEEKAFYDALTQPQAVKDVYTNDELVALTRELTETLRKNRTIDWQLHVATRAKMCLLVKRLLKKYKYPPEEAEGALSVVIRQCELWADYAPEA